MDVISKMINPYTENNVDDISLDVSGKLVLNLPVNNILDLMESAQVVTLMVYDYLISVSVDKLLENGIDPQDKDQLDNLVKTIESNVDVESIAHVSKTQQISKINGNAFFIEKGALVPGTDSLKIIIPSVKHNIKVEVLDKTTSVESLELMDVVKPEFRTESSNLTRVLKPTAIAEVLNSIQLSDYETELELYFKMILKMRKDSHTRVYALAQMRAIMQYAINVDTLEMQALLTEEVLGDE